MATREWTGVDLYGVLGVEPTATREEIAAAYRARARELHPDTGAAGPVAAGAFTRVVAAYRVLSGPQREEYDRARRRGDTSRVTGSPGAPSSPAPGWHLTRGGARGALWGGIVLVVLGIGAAAVVTLLAVRDARLRSEGVPVTAQVVREAGGVRLEFTTREGSAVQTAVPDAKSGGARAGEALDVRYDPADPTRVVTARATVARDITLGIVAVKLLVAGIVLTVVGARRLAQGAG